MAPPRILRRTLRGRSLGRPSWSGAPGSSWSAWRFERRATSADPVRDGRPEVAVRSRSPALGRERGDGGAVDAHPLDVDGRGDGGGHDLGVRRRDLGDELLMELLAAV